MIGAGEDDSVGRLLDTQDIAFIQATIRLFPAPARVNAVEEPAQVLIVHDTHKEPVWILAVRDYPSHNAMREAAIGSYVMVKPIRAGQHSTAIGCQQDVVGLARIDQDVVDDDVRSGI